MTAWDKTLARFKANKASGDPYWEAGEMVPIHELEPYREINRKTHEKYPGHYNEIKAKIEKNGIDDMGILYYNPGTHRVYQGEGNTRLAIAKELGFTHVPVRVYRSGHQKAVGGVAPRPWSSERRVPQDIKPSEIGFTARDLKESYDDAHEVRQLVHQYISDHGAEDITGHGMPLRDVLHSPVHAKGQCDHVSYHFKNWADSRHPEHDYKIISGEAPATPNTYPPEFNDHYAVLVNNTHVVDLTRRQFEPTVPVQTIMHVKDWRRKHPDPEIYEGVMDDNNISIMLRESQRFLDEEDSFMAKASTVVSNAAAGLKSFGSALFSKPTSPPAGSAAPGFAPKDTSTKAVVQTKLDSVLGQAGAAAGGKSATAPASTPMRNSVERMIKAIAEGNFDWQELDKLYGSDFSDVKTPQSREVAQVHPGYGDVGDLLVKHGYQPMDVRGRSAYYMHPDGHAVDVDTDKLEWNHYGHGGSWTAAGRGIGDLDSHLRGYHRAW